MGNYLATQRFFKISITKSVKMISSHLYCLPFPTVHAVLTPDDMIR